MDLFDLVAKLTLDTSEYEKGMSDAESKTSGIKDKWNQATSQISTGLKGIASGAGILTALGAGAFKAADGVSKNLDNIDKMSQKLGLSTDAYQEWDYVMKISGTSIDNMAMGLKTLTNKFDDAVNGSDSAIETFGRLGLSMEDIQGLSREDLFAQVIYAFQGMEDSAERAALANDLLGRSGQELAPLFNTSAEETQNLIAQVRDLGGVISEDAVKQGAAFQDSLTSLNTAFSGAASTLMENLIPTITTLMDKISNFVAAGGLDRLIELFQEWAPVIAAVVAAIGGFKIVEGVITLVQGFSAAFGVLNTVLAANPIGIVVLAIAGLVAAFVVLWNKCDAFREFWINAWEGIKDKFSKVTDALSGFFGKLGDKFNEAKENMSKLKEHAAEKFSQMRDNIGERMDAIKNKVSDTWDNIKANPTVQAIFDWVSNTFNNLKETLSGTFTGIKDMAAAAWDLIKTTILAPVVLLIDLINGDTEKFKEDLAKTWNKIKESAEKIWEGLKKAVSAIVDGFIKQIKTNIEGFAKILKTIWEGVKSKAVELWTSIKDKVVTIASNLISGVKEWIQKLPDMIREKFTEAIEFIKNLPSQALTWGKDLIDSFIGGITSKIQAVRDAVSSVAGAVRDFIGFSEPDKGPLSNFHTFAPDMMNLFIKGIEDNEKRLTDAVAGAFDFEELIKVPAVDAQINGSGSFGAAGRANYYTINVNQPISTPADMLREIRTEAQYGLMIGEALA